MDAYVAPCPHGNGRGRHGRDRCGDEACGPQFMWLRQVLGLAVVGPQHQHLGHVRDLVVRPPADPPSSLVIGLVVDVGGHRTRLPATAVGRWLATAVEMREVIDGRPGPGSSPERTGVCLGGSVLGQPVLTTPRGTHPRRVTDVGLRRSSAGWTVCAVDTRARWQRLCGRSRRLTDWSHVVRRHRIDTPRTPRSLSPGAADGPRARPPSSTTGGGRGHRRNQI